jgi:sodium-dependent dicarboxylate transporter 2/3/5
MNVDQDGKYLKLTFSTWLALNFPAMVVNLIIAWVYLSIQYNGMTYFTSFFKKKSTKEDEDAYVWKSNVVQTLLRQEYQKLGKIGFHEIAVGLIFTLVVCLWIFRETGENVSWGKLISGAATGDSTAAMIGVMLLFIIPKNWSFLRDGEGDQGIKM